MPGKLEKLEHTAAQLLASGLIDSLEDFDETASAMVAGYYQRREEEIAAKADKLEAKLRQALAEADRGEGISYDSPEAAAQAIADEVVLEG